MSVRPIDLQTLFAHLNQVGKDQASQKEAAALQQAQQARHLVKEMEEKDHSINETKKTEEGLDKVGDKERQQTAEEEQQKKREKEKEELQKKSRAFFQDPDIGHNIDLEG